MRVSFVESLCLIVLPLAHVLNVLVRSSVFLRALIHGGCPHKSGLNEVCVCLADLVCSEH